MSKSNITSAPNSKTNLAPVIGKSNTQQTIDKGVELQQCLNKLPIDAMCPYINAGVSVLNIIGGILAIVLLNLAWYNKNQDANLQDPSYNLGCGISSADLNKDFENDKCKAKLILEGAKKTVSILGYFTIIFIVIINIFYNTIINLLKTVCNIDINSQEFIENIKKFFSNLLNRKSVEVSPSEISQQGGGLGISDRIKNFEINTDKIWEFIKQTIGKDLQFLNSIIHILFATIIYLFASDNTEQVPILVLTILGILLIIGYGLGSITNIGDKFTSYRLWYILTGVILGVISLLMFIFDFDNLGINILYNFLSYDVLIWWFIFILSILFYYLGNSNDNVTRVHTYINNEFNGTLLTIIKLILIFVGIIFSLYNNLKSQNGSDTSISGGQTTVIILLDIIYILFILVVDGVFTFLNFKDKPIKLTASKNLCDLSKQSYTSKSKS